MSSLSAIWQAAQIQGSRPYQEDALAIVQGDFIFYRNQSYPVEAGLWPPHWSLYVLVDGMGGMGNGDLAAALITESFIESFLNGCQSDLPIPDQLPAAAKAANQAISERVKQEPDCDGMGATLIAVLWDRHAGQCHWLSIGDSLLALLRAGQWQRLNVRHNWDWLAEQKRERGEIVDADWLANVGHVLCSAVDGSPLNIIDQSLEPLTIQTGDILILASDGIEVLSEQTLTVSLNEALRGESAPEIDEAHLTTALRTLFGKLKEQDAPNQDNCSLILAGFTHLETVQSS
jgi:serine/threonine protein phosphatase PrpC